MEKLQLAVLELIKEYCESERCETCVFHHDDRCTIQTFTKGDAPCCWGVPKDEQDEHDKQDKQDKSEENKQYLKDFEVYCRIENRKRYERAREKWYFDHYRCTRSQYFAQLWRKNHLCKLGKSYGDENFLWFNPNEFEGF